METNSISIGVSTGAQEFDNLSPSETYTGSFDIINTSSIDSIAYKIIIAPYSVNDISYDANFSDRDDYNQIVDWIKLEDTSGELNENERKKINFKIEVPENAPAGGQYASFLVQIVNREGEKNELSLSSKSQVASLVYATVAGETIETADILENNINIINIDRPVSFSSMVENTGNVHLSAAYNFRIYSLFSNEEIFSNEDTPAVSTLLPETIYYTEKKWEETPKLGIFRVVQEISVADSLETFSSSERIVFVCPSWFLILCSLFIFSMIFWFILRIRERKYNIKLA